MVRLVASALEGKIYGIWYGKHRSLEIDGICNICGIEKEDAHHVVVNCTKARALREKIREPWALPKEPVLAEPNLDWLLNA